MDNNYNTLFDSDLAEYEYIKSQPVKSPEAAPSAPTISSAPAASANTVDSLKKNERRCRCNSVADGQRCKFFERRPT